MSDVEEFNRLVVGARFKISELGATRLRSLAGKTGIVVEVFRSNTGVTVLFDGAKSPTCLHRDFITPISRNASASANNWTNSSAGPSSESPPHCNQSVTDVGQA